MLAFAGIMGLQSVRLTCTVSPLIMWFTLFIGQNLRQSAFTKACPAAWAFRKMGFKAGGTFE